MQLRIAFNADNQEGLLRWKKPLGFARLVTLAAVLLVSAALGTAACRGQASDTARQERRAEIGPEKIVLTDGLQAFMFQTAKGTLVAEAQLTLRPGHTFPAKNVFPAIPGWIISRDKGKSWKRWTPKGVVASSPYEPIPHSPMFEGAATELSDGAVVVLEWIADGPSQDGTWIGNLWESRDDCQTLQGPTPMTIHLPQAKSGHDDSGRPYSGLTFHRSLLQLPGGDLIAPAYCWFKEDTTPVTYQPKMSKTRCILLRSGDCGRSWRYVATIAADSGVGQEGFNEPVLLRLGKGPRAGRLICLMRTGRDTPLYQAHSDDDGTTWSVPQSMGFYGVDPDILETFDGMLVCGFVWLTDGDSRRPQAPVYLAVSRDQGEKWNELIRLPDGEDPRHGRWSHYGSLEEIEPGLLLALYDVIPNGWMGTVRYVASREIRLPR